MVYLGLCSVWEKKTDSDIESTLCIQLGSEFYMEVKGTLHGTKWEVFKQEDGSDWVSSQAQLYTMERGGLLTCPFWDLSHPDLLVVQVLISYLDNFGVKLKWC